MASQNPPQGALPLDASVFRSNERYCYATRFKGQPVGQLQLLTLAKTAESPLRFRTHYDTGKTIIQSTVEVDHDTLYPRRMIKTSRGEGGDLDIEAHYESGLVRLRATTPTGPQGLVVPASKPLYDNEQLLFLLRALPLSQSLKVGFESVNIDAGSRFFTWVKTEPGGPIEVPAGRFDTTLVKLHFDSHGTISVWYATERPHAMIRYDGHNEVAMERIPCRPPSGDRDGEAAVPAGLDPEEPQVAR